MRILSFAFVLSVLLAAGNAQAQMAASKDAQYLATIKAVANYKVDDEETARDMEKLRQNKRFNDKLQKMMDKLSNNRTKDSKNKKVLQILEDAGKEIYNTLN